MKTTSILALAALAGTGLAHPGHAEPANEILAKRNYNALARRGLAACAGKLEKRGHHKQAAERRAATVEKYRRARGLTKRDTATILATDHHSNQSYTNATAESTIFDDSGVCVLAPEATVGPYWVKGEYVRTNLVEDQAGVPIVLEGQFLDIETCEPLTNVWWDIWNCNATGVYSGVVSNGNGDSSDTSNLDATFLRGIQQADSDGVVTFETIFPGHYTGRTTHHHMIARLDGTIAENGTLTGGTVAHIGQAFWDQDLISQVEATAPYSTNTQTVTTNAEDDIFIGETEDTTADPIFEYVFLGDDITDGIFGWLTIAVNTSATYDPTYAAELTSTGGVANSDSSMGGSGGPSGSGNFTGGAGGPGGNSTASGAPPSGTSGSLLVNGTSTSTSTAATSTTSVDASTGGATSGTSFITVTKSTSSDVQPSSAGSISDESDRAAHDSDKHTGSLSPQASQTSSFAISPSHSQSLDGPSGKNGQMIIPERTQYTGLATSRLSKGSAGQPSGTMAMAQPSGKTSHVGNGGSGKKHIGQNYQ